MSDANQFKYDLLGPGKLMEEIQEEAIDSIKQMWADLTAERSQRILFEKRLQALIKQIGSPGTCRGCGASIYWVKHHTGRTAPYSPMGLNHFAECPNAKAFRK